VSPISEEGIFEAFLRIMLYNQAIETSKLRHSGMALQRLETTMLDIMHCFPMGNKIQ
jgi:hypothetical protein